jgi:cell division protein ZapA
LTYHAAGKQVIPVKAVEIQILGQKFKISSDNSEEHVRELADYVNRKLEELRGSTKNAPAQSLLFLGMLNIADEFYRFREEKNSQIEKVTTKVKRLIELIDEGA